MVRCLPSLGKMGRSFSGPPCCMPRARIMLQMQRLLEGKKLGWAMGSPCLACTPHLDACRVDTLFILGQQQTTRPSNSHRLHRQPARLQIESVLPFHAPAAALPARNERLSSCRRARRRRSSGAAAVLSPAPPWSRLPMPPLSPTSSRQEPSPSGTALPRLRLPTAGAPPPALFAGCAARSVGHSGEELHGCGSWGVQPSLGLHVPAAADS